MTFSTLGLNERLLKALDAQDFKTPTPIQEAMIPVALKGRDIQASAETGSGKTAAFLLPIIQKLAENPAPRSNTRALIVLPTRELAQQIWRTCVALSSFTKVTCDLVTGGTGLQDQQAQLRKNPEIIIGTPGRLLEHVQKASIVLGDVEVLVLDEADRMLDMGFREDVLAIAEACRADRQNFLLSATLHHIGFGKIAKEVLRNPEIIALGSHREQHEQINQEFILADDNGHKRQLLVWLLAHESFEKALVFTNTRDYAEELSTFLRAQNLRASCLHGEMPHPERKKIMQRFRNDSLPLLVATDLASRGLDIAGVDLVVNFHLARSGDDFVHRTGRTGRAGKQGKAISLVSPQEWNGMQSIVRYLSLDPVQREVENMVARFTGEAKGKKVSKKKDEKASSRKRTPADKAKERHRNKKNIGKRRASAKPEGAAQQKPSASKAVKTGTASAPPKATGFAPLKRKKG